MREIYLITKECDAYDPYDITATYTDIVGYVETKEQAKEFCSKRNAEYEYKEPYSYECVSKIDKED